MLDPQRFGWKFHLILFAVWWAARSGANCCQAAPRDWVPSNAVAFIAVPSLPEAETAWASDPFFQLWHSSEMKPFRTQVADLWRSRVAGPIEQQLGISLVNYFDLLQGEIGLALFAEREKGPGRPVPGALFFFDAGEKQAELEAAIKKTRQAAEAAGIHADELTIGEASFLHLRIDMGRIARVLRQIGSGEEPEPVTGGDAPEGGAASRNFDLILGNLGSFGLVASDPSLVRAMIKRRNGKAGQGLQGHPRFASVFEDHLKGADVYGWLDFRRVYDMALAWAARRAKDARGGNGSTNYMPQPAAILEASGLGAIENLFFRAKRWNDGSTLRLGATVPKADRKGFFNMFHFEPSPAAPPPKVPAAVSRFIRIRLDGRNVWRSMETMINEVSPALGGMLQLILAPIGKDRDPNFDFRQSLIENLGDDWIYLEWPPKSVASEDLASAPNLFLLASPNSEKLADAILAATGLIPASGGVLQKKEVLGRTLYTFSATPLGGGSPTEEIARLHFVASGKYLAFSTSEEVIERYLRSTGAAAHPLKDVPALKAAADRVGGFHTGWFEYENFKEPMRLWYEAIRTGSADSVLHNFLGGANPPKTDRENGKGPAGLERALDLSKLPPFGRIERYLRFSVATGNTDDRFLHFDFFWPDPPGLNREATP